MGLSKKTKKKLELDPGRIPEHIAIIMDGNGRWAKRRGMPRVFGHRAGVKTVDRILQECIKLNIKVLTLYTFSMENWHRPEFEISALMDLLHSNLISQRKKLLTNDVQLRVSGQIDRFPDRIRTELLETIRITSQCKTLTLNLALGYSGREEILAACRKLAEKIKSGQMSSDEITEQAFSSHLYTQNLPDPDLIIRTSGEYRLSNFLLWQSSYSELYFTKVLWPNFSRKDLVKALESYQKRDRRFGGVRDKETDK